MADVTAPYSSYRTTVPEAWLDYNGHMHDASYGIAFSDANEELFAALGLSADYRASAGASFFTVECHIRYLAECSLGQQLSASTVVVAADVRKMRLYTELLLDDEAPAATGEFFYLHVDTGLGTTVPLPADLYERVQRLLAAHAHLDRPPHLGLGVGARPVATEAT